MDSEGISDGLADRKVEIRVRRNGRKDKVIVEKSAAEGLPEGWIKKLVITNRAGRKTRKDPFFIDPKSGYIFQSFKDASRYVETGYIGIYARKLKESSIEDDDSRNGKTFLPLESMEKRSANDLLEKEKNINIYVRNSKRRNLSSSDEHSENCNINSDLSSVTSQVLEDLGKKEEAKSSMGKQLIVKRVTRSQAKASKNEEDLRKNLSSTKSKSKSEEDTVKSRLSSARSQGKESVTKEEEEQDSPEKRITRSKATMKKSELSKTINRRTSKRLAGIELEPTPELKTRTKAQRVVPPDDDTTRECKQPVNPVATDSPKKTEAAKASNEHSSQKPNSSADAAAISNNTVSAEMEIEKICNPVIRNLSIDKKMKTRLVISEEELNPVFHLIGYKQSEEMSPVSPLSRQTSATKLEKTAVSKKLRRSSPKANKVTSPKATEISPLRSSNKSEHLSENFNANQRWNSFSKDSSESSVVRGECSEVMEKNTNSFSSAFDSTLADLCKDPCIAFAIKTLTGEALHLPNTAAVSSDPNLNHAKQKGVTFSPETPVNVNTDSTKPGLSSELPGEDIWKDPCIDFAIKTLTGAIPIELQEPDAKLKSQGITITTATQEQEGKQNRSCDYLLQQQCSKMEKKTVGKSDDLRSP